ncbi:DUF3097 family protein [Canibacter zhoujuaniae]|uniref:DUF3097 family protein n=1 Tax=Canibacter zhoujuaniae TaxID=2708343 RepID=UPI001420FE9F|nr:DUF3097 family protein [Canibacter zhoujuaniae]
MWEDIYGSDPLENMRPRRGPVERKTIVLQKGLVLEHSQTEWAGAVVGADNKYVKLEDFRGSVRTFAINDAFLLEGKPVRLTLPTRKPQRQRTASGSFAGEVKTGKARARIAQPSRIFVEGRHDAELIADVWGDDLREVGVVVEYLEGADHLQRVLQEFQPTAARRAGVLLDHLVQGSKESRIASTAIPASQREFVRIVGHPFIDIWQAVKPERLGIPAWPEIPHGTDWKTGVCKKLGWPAADQADIADAWQRIRARVRDYRDLEPSLVGPVESLIDFVTVGV